MYKENVSKISEKKKSYFLKTNLFLCSQHKMFITEASAASSQAVEHENAVLSHVFQFLISDI